MLTWKAIAIIAGALAACGATFDTFLLHRQKKSLLLFLLSYWNKLDETRYRNLAKSLSSWVIYKFDHLFPGSFLSLRALLFWTIASWLLTSAASVIGFTIDPDPAASVPLPLFPTYIANWFFDLATIAITLKVIKIIKEHSPIVGFFSLLADAAIAIVLAILCLTTTLWLNNIARNLVLPGTGETRSYLTEAFKHRNMDVLKSGGFTEKMKVNNIIELSFAKSLKDSTNLFLAAAQGRRYVATTKLNYKVTEGPLRREYVEIFSGKMFVAWILIPNTVILPTLFFLFLLIIILISKMVLDGHRRIMLHFLELATQDDPDIDPKGFKPGTLIGIVLALLATIAKSVSELWVLWR